LVLIPLAVVGIILVTQSASHQKKSGRTSSVRPPVMKPPVIVQPFKGPLVNRPAVPDPPGLAGVTDWAFGDILPAGASRSYVVKLKADRTYVIDMTSAAFDTFLELYDPAGKKIADDDDSGGGLNARIIVTAPRDGEYRIQARSFHDGSGGP